MNERKAVFLDRDGVINRKAPDGDYVKNWEEFAFLPGAVEGMKFLAAEEYDIYIVTNQRGVARGMMTESDVERIHEHMASELKKEGIEIKGVYYCPHEKGTCDCRKPLPGMFLRAAREHGVRLEEALCVGDSESDSEAARAAGCGQVVTMPIDGNLLSVVEKILCKTH